MNKIVLIIFYSILNLYSSTFCSQNIQTILSFEEHTQQSKNIVLAVMLRDLQQVKDLLDQGVNPNTKNYFYGGPYFQGNTLLHITAKIGAPEMIQVLLENKADRSLQDKLSKTALWWCKENLKLEECPEKRAEYQKASDLLQSKNKRF